MNKTNLNTWFSNNVVTIPRVYDDDIVIEYQQVRDRLKCNDGTELSVQASKTHYCAPRVNQSKVGDAGYTHIEVWCVTDRVPDEWNEYGGGEEPYAYIPIELVEQFIDSHGGIAE